MSIIAARRRAETLVERLALPLPIDVHAVARSLGVAIVTARLGEDISGLLITEAGAATICVQRGHHRRRQRFTIAHEIGHYYLRHQFEPGDHVHVDRGTLVSHRSGRSAEGTDPKEVEANQFAASLLMPKALVEREIDRHSSMATDAVVTALAKRFDVSEQAMAIRLGTLGWL